MKILKMKSTNSFFERISIIFILPPPDRRMIEHRFIYNQRCIFVLTILTSIERCVCSCDRNSGFTKRIDIPTSVQFKSQFTWPLHESRYVDTRFSFTRLKCTINVKRRNFAHKREIVYVCMCMCVCERERNIFVHFPHDYYYYFNKAE